MEIGETREVVAAIPDDHPNEALRGKKSKYTLTLNGLSEKVLPEIDDDFAKSLDLEVETLLELRIKVRDELEEAAVKNSKQDVQVKIMDQLLEKNEFKVPQEMVDDEIRGILVREGVLDPNKMDVRNVAMDPYREQLGEISLKRVRTTMMVDRIGEQENVTASDEDFEEGLKSLAENAGVGLDAVRKIYSDRDQGGHFRRELTRNKVLDFLYERAEVELVEEKEEKEEKE